MNYIIIYIYIRYKFLSTVTVLIETIDRMSKRTYFTVFDLCIKRHTGC